MSAWTMSGHTKESSAMGMFQKSSRRGEWPKRCVAFGEPRSIPEATEIPRNGMKTPQLFETLFWEKIGCQIDTQTYTKEQPTEMALTIAAANECSFCPGRDGGPDPERWSPSPQRVMAAHTFLENELDVIGAQEGHSRHQDQVTVGRCAVWRSRADNRVVEGAEYQVRTTRLMSKPSVCILHPDPRRLQPTTTLDAVATRAINDPSGDRGIEKNKSGTILRGCFAR